MLSDRRHVNDHITARFGVRFHPIDRRRLSARYSFLRHSGRQSIADPLSGTIRFSFSGEGVFDIKPSRSSYFHLLNSTISPHILFSAPSRTPSLHNCKNQHDCRPHLLHRHTNHGLVFLRQICRLGTRSITRWWHIAPDRSARQMCWDGRDSFFQCLERHGIVDSVREDEKAKKLCAPELKEFEKYCASSWVGWKH